jgi:hypothetical protein
VIASKVVAAAPGRARCATGRRNAASLPAPHRASIAPPAAPVAGQANGPAATGVAVGVTLGDGDGDGDGVGLGACVALAVGLGVGLGVGVGTTMTCVVENKTNEYVVPAVKVMGPGAEAKANAFAPATVAGPASVVQPAAGLYQATYRSPAGTDKPDGNTNVKAGHDAKVRFAVAVTVTKTIGVSDTPIAFGKRAEAETATPLGFVSVRPSVAAPLAPVVPGSVTEPV